MAKVRYQIQLNTEKINEDLFYKGQKGTYLNVVLFENEDGEDKWGNVGFAVQEVTKEQREAGVKGEILGNYKEIKPRQNQGQESRKSGYGSGQQRSAPSETRRPPADADLDPNQPDDIPF